MKSVMTRYAIAAALILSSAIAMAQEPRPYVEGTVTEVTYIKIKPGMFDAYLRWVATDRKQLMEAYKKAGIILDYKVYATQETHTAMEPDIILTVVYKNMAALDGLDDRQDAAGASIMGTRQKAAEAAISREQMREVLGSRLIRELVLK